MYEERHQMKVNSRIIPVLERKGLSMSIKDIREKNTQLYNLKRIFKDLSSIGNNSFSNNIMQFTASSDFKSFADETMLLSEDVKKYDKSIDFSSKKSQGLEHWVEETTEAGRRKYAEWHAKNHFKGIRFGTDNITEADLVSSDLSRAIEVKRTIGKNSAVMNLIENADMQLYNRYEGTVKGTIYIEIANKSNKWPWHGNTKEPDIHGEIGDAVLNQLKDLKPPLCFETLIFTYPNGNPWGLAEVKCNLSLDSSGNADNILVNYRTENL